MYPYKHVLFVCHANTSRSVMAEHLLVRLLSDHAVPSDAVLVTSGGIAPYARDGSLVSLDTRLVLRDVDIHLEPDAVARDLKRGHRHLLDHADLIITMTEEQVRMVLAQMGDAEKIDKPVVTLRDFAKPATSCSVSFGLRTTADATILFVSRISSARASLLPVRASFTFWNTESVWSRA